MSRETSIGLAHLSAIDLPPKALIDLAADTGCGSIALRLHSAAPGTPVYPMVPGSAELRDLLVHAVSRNVRISEVELVPIDAALDTQSLEPLFETACQLGAKGVIVTGDIDDTDLMTARFSELCELAWRYELIVLLEFMRWRSIGSLDQAVGLLRRSGRANARLVIDCLHLFRSGSTVEDLAAVPTGMIGIAQLCDASKELQGDIVAEARSGRLGIGSGALPVEAFLAALPKHCELALEIPSTGDGADRRHLLRNSRLEILRLLGE